MVLKTSCQHCGVHIEFDIEAVNQFVACPSCGEQTRLLMPSKPATVSSAPVKANQHIQSHLAIFVGVVLAIVILGIVISFTLTRTSSETRQYNLLESSYSKSSTSIEQPLSAEEKTSRENILKALLEVQSATAVGVTRDRYGELLIKADSTVNFEKTKLSYSRNSDFLANASDAIRWYSKANHEWDSYFKYDWMREKDQALMFPYTLEEISKLGVKIDTAQLSRDPDLKDTYLVPFKACLSLYWEAADVFVEKLKGEISH